MTQVTFWNWFYNSATILWARFGVLFGCVLTVLTMTNMAPWLPAKYLPIWIVINGVITEYLRRTNTKTNAVVVEDDAGVKSEITYLQGPSPIPPGSTLLKVKEGKS